MAATQKKDAGKGKSKSTASAAGKRSASRQTPAPGKRTAQKTAPAPRPIRREVWAVVCLLLALFSALGYFQIQAIFIDFFCSLIKGLLGYGFWLMPPMLLWAGVILLFHRGRPVRARVACTLLLPVMLGSILQLFLSQGEYAWNGELLPALWTSGEALESGGVVSGLLALGLSAVFSRLGTQILMILGAAAMVMASFKINPVDIFEWYRNRPHPEYVYEEEPRKREQPERQRVPAPAPDRSRSRRNIDIPLEDEETAEEPRSGKRGRSVGRRSAASSTASRRCPRLTRC